MANDSTGFFYWYRRYKVRAQDMTDFQTAMVETARGLGEGLAGAAVVKGGEIAVSGAMGLSVGATIATAASGYLHVQNGAVFLDASDSADASLPTRSLVVLTPALTDADYVGSPTIPFTQVPLHQLQKTEVKLIAGTPSTTPDYPAKGDNDVILCGLIVPPGISSLTESMFDFEVRESIGVNSLIEQNQVRFDDRLMPYRASYKSLGIKPSQSVGSGPLAMSYPGRLSPSVFPLTAGIFTPLDTFIDFSTGMISGGDATTPAFTPIIPSGSNSQIVVVTLCHNDTLRFNYGTAGGFSQCLNAIRNQVYSGAGALPPQDGNFPLAFVILTSNGGSLSDIQVMDGRPFLGSGAAAAKYKSETPSGTIDGSNAVFTLSKTPSDVESLIFMVDSNILTDDQFSISGKIVTITDVDVIPVKGQSVYAKYLVFGAVSQTVESTFNGAQFTSEVPIGTVDGVNDTFTLLNVPIDSKSLFLFVGVNLLEDSDFTLVGSTITITNPALIPQVGQGIYIKYLKLGVIPAGGGGGVSGYMAVGSRTSPQVITAVGITPLNVPLQQWFIRSPGGAVAVSGSPQIGAGNRVGDVMKLKVVDGSNYPVFVDGSGIDMNAAMWPATGGTVDGASIELSWDGVYWSEDSRR
jgi:hypothetical protein